QIDVGALRRHGRQSSGCRRAPAGAQKREGRHSAGLRRCAVARSLYGTSCGVAQTPSKPNGLKRPGGTLVWLVNSCDETGGTTLVVSVISVLWPVTCAFNATSSHWASSCG